MSKPAQQAARATAVPRPGWSRTTYAAALRPHVPKMRLGESLTAAADAAAFVALARVVAVVPVVVVDADLAPIRWVAVALFVLHNMWMPTRAAAFASCLVLLLQPFAAGCGTIPFAQFADAMRAAAGAAAAATITWADSRLVPGRVYCNGVHKPERYASITTERLRLLAIALAAAFDIGDLAAEVNIDGVAKVCGGKVKHNTGSNGIPRQWSVLPLGGAYVIRHFDRALRAYAAVVLGAEPGPQTPALLADTVYAWWDEEHKPSLASLGVQSWGAAALLICEVDALDVLDMEILLSFCDANNSAIQKAGVAAPTALMLSDLLHMAYYGAAGRPQNVDGAVRKCAMLPSIWSGVGLCGVLLVRPRKRASS